MAGMSLQKLADALGNVVTKQSLNKYEQGIMKPDSNLLVQLSNVLNVPVDYFFAEPNVLVELTNPDYRKHSSRLSATEKAAIEEKSKNLLEKYLELELLLNLQEQPQYFRFGKEILTPEDASKSFDGLSAEVNGIRVIVLNGSLFKGNNARKRFTALHELAHRSLIIPEHLSQRDAEKLCHVFASAVLYPEEMVKKELHSERFHFFENELILIKERWGISISAIFHRALRLGIITGYVFKNLNIGYRSRGYYKDEPGNYLSQEKPVRFLRLVYFALGKELISVNEAAYYTNMTVWEFSKSMHQLI